MRRWWVACYTWTLEQLVSLFAMYSALRWRCSIQDKNLYEPNVSSKTNTFKISERSLSRWGEKIQNFSPGGGRGTRKFLNILKSILLSISPLIFFNFFFRSLPAFFIAPFVQTKSFSQDRLLPVHDIQHRLETLFLQYNLFQCLQPLQTIYFKFFHPPPPSPSQKIMVFSL